MAVNYVRYLSAPPGTLTTDVAATANEGATPPAPASSAAPSLGASPALEEDWPSYNKTLTSNRFSQLSLINKGNVGNLKVLCTYDTGQYTGFTTGLIEVNGALIGTTEYDIFSLDPGQLPSELADPRRLHAGDAAGRQSRRRLHGRQIVPGHPGRPRLGLRFQDRQALVGNGGRRSEEGRNYARCSDCVGRPGVHRQCGRRH